MVVAVQLNRVCSRLIARGEVAPSINKKEYRAARAVMVRADAAKHEHNVMQQHHEEQFPPLKPRRPEALPAVR